MDNDLSLEKRMDELMKVIEAQLQFNEKLKDLVFQQTQRILALEKAMEIKLS